MTKIFDVFLSHNSKDKPWVINLKIDLETLRIKVWLDKDEIRPGDLFAKALERGIEESSSVALIISPESMNSGWVEAEYYRALSFATYNELQLIPVLYKKAQIPGFLKDRSWVDFSNQDDYAEQLKTLVWGITGIKPTSPPIPDDALSKALQLHVKSARQIVDQQMNLFSSASYFYEDQCDLAASQIENLNSIAENIKSILPANYNTLAVITNLDSQIKAQRDHLVDFRKTLPTSDAKQREILLDQLNLINSLLMSVSCLTVPI